MWRWIKKAAVSFLIKDDTPYPRTQVTYNQVTKDAYRFSPYGISSHPPLDSLVVLLSPDGRPDDPVALIANPLGRFKDLEEGEVQAGNDLTGSFVKFRADKGVEWFVAEDGDLVVTLTGGDASIDVTGNIDVTATGNVNITAPTVAITGNLTVTGTITGTIDVLGGPLSTSLSSHTHADPLSGNTGPPN